MIEVVPIRPQLRAACVQWATLLFLSLLASHAVGQSFTRSMLVGRVDPAVDRPLPSIAEIVGGDLSLPAAPVIAIGFLTNRMHGAALDWGGAIGWYLMEAASGVDTGLAVMPARFYVGDARGESDEAEDRAVQLSRAALRTGARFELTGTVNVDNNRFELILQLLDYPEERVLASRQDAGELDKLDSSVQTLADQLIVEAIAATGTSPAAARVAIPALAPGELNALAQAFARLKGSPAAEQAAAYDAIRREHRDFASFTSLYLTALATASDAPSLRAKLPGVLADGESSIAVQTYVYALESQYATTGIDPDAIAKLTELVRMHPNSPAAWLALSNAYIYENVMYSPENKCRCSPPIDHHLGYAKAIVVAREMARRWPDNYHSWWALSYNLSWYAALVRGAGYWRDVPDANKRRFGELMSLGDDCLFEAIRLHPYEGMLFATKIGFDAQANRDPMTSFRIAAGFSPRARYPYHQAFNYAGPRWGGSMENLREVYRLARVNNPGTDWPRTLRDEIAPEAKPFVDFDNPWISRALAGVAALLAVVVLAAIWRTFRGGR